MSPRLRRAAAVLLALLTLAVLGGCVALPESGPVRAAPADVQIDDDGALDYTPGGPKPGATPGNIVENFLVAMTATPVNTSVARQFLTDASSRTWVPEKGTLVFGEKQVLPHGSSVELRLTHLVALDGRGEWKGDPTHGAGETLRLHLVKEAGQWRISDPPDALVIPATHFASTFTQYFLYFFDKTAQALVPEPVYVPRGAQASTVLVSGLLAGPDRSLLGVERTFLPARVQLDDLSVPVSLDGTAQVPLTNQILNLDNDHLSLAFAQLAWTLGQIPGLDRMRVTVDGSPLDLPGEGTDVPVNSWTEYDPSVAWASQSLFGLRDGRVVAETEGRETRTTGVFGSLALGVDSFAVDLQAVRVAAVTAGRTRVSVAPIDRTGAAEPTASDAAVVYVGTDLLRPAYDLTGQLWLLDRTSSGARVEVVRRGVAKEVVVPGITRQDVTAFAVSRDGTRFVAGVRGRTRDTLEIARVRRSDDGRVTSVGAASTLPLGTATPTRIRDVAWRTTGSLAVLTRPEPRVSEVVVVKVDGSSAPGDLAADSEPFRDWASRLVTAPSLGSPLYLGAGGGRLYTLTATGRWATAGIPSGLRAPTFPG
ncbi:MAG: LpqB family beta-propeller domain-containing protein [Nocardioidaceae bacterium]